MRKAYSYIRFSSAAQAKGNSLRRQIERSQVWCERNECVLDETLNLRDLGVSAFRGSNVRDGALAGFLQACEDGRVQPGSVLIVESLDRLTRQQIQLALRLFLSILEMDVSIVTIEPEQVYTPNDKNPMTVIQAVLVLCRANEESATKSSRVHDAWNNKRRMATKVKMTGKCPAWLKLVNGDFEQLPDAVAGIKRTFELCLEGVGIRRVTSILIQEGHKPFGTRDHWTMTYISKILRTRAVIGECQPHVIKDGRRVHQGDPIPGYFPVIINEADFYRANVARKGRRNKGGRTAKSDANLFQGLLYHAGDRETMVLKRPTGGEQKYLYIQSGAYLHGKKSVGERSFPYRPLEEAVLGFLKELKPEDVTDRKRKATNVEGELAKVEDELLVIEQKLRQVNDRVHKASGDIEAYLGLLETLNADKKAALQRREQLKAKATSNAAESLNDLQAVVDLIHEAQGQQLDTLRRRVKGKIAALVDSIWMHIEKQGRRKLALVQVFLKSGESRKLRVVHPMPKAGESWPAFPPDLADVDLRNYAASANARTSTSGQQPKATQQLTPVRR